MAAVPTKLLGQPCARISGSGAGAPSARIRVNGPRCWHERLTVDIALTDAGLRYRLQLSNGVLTYTPAPQREAADVAVSLPRAALPALAATAPLPSSDCCLTDVVG